jgi:hypothetical protein
MKAGISRSIVSTAVMRALHSSSLLAPFGSHHELGLHLADLRLGFFELTFKGLRYLNSGVGLNAS